MIDHTRTRWVRQVAGVATVGVVAALVGSCGSAPMHPSSVTPPETPPPGLEAFYNQQFDWKKCDDDASLECAGLTVPLDYADPGGDTLTIAVARHVAGHSYHGGGACHIGVSDGPQ